MHRPLLQPALVLVLWTFVMWAWMYATRLPAMRLAGMKPDPTAPRGEQMATLPPHVRWKADNYNHLLEQPTVFYPVILSLVVMGDTSRTNVALAWTYVALRVAHSLVQSLINKIEVRFLLFAISSLVLLVLTVRAALLVF